MVECNNKWCPAILCLSHVCKSVNLNIVMRDVKFITNANSMAWEYVWYLMCICVGVLNNRLSFLLSSETEYYL
jgi:hypothetical protein